MLPDNWDRIQSVFLAAVDKPFRERAALLDEACQGDNSLRAEVESLLANDGGGMNAVSAAIAGEASSLIHRPKLQTERARIGPWLLVRELGHGGMGTVYLAVRDDREYEARAAIKLVRQGLDTDFILRRFRRERQILAGLEHPNIARMFDGGTQADGISYFVMEYVDGLWITLYAAEHKLSVEQRIRLFMPVCRAVAYAHRHFIVHRDLKPANILIDGGGVPKLLDFGVSKLLHSEQSEWMEGEMMTPDYASPEQILGAPVTLASDVYSLGVVLYELLTQSPPRRIERCTPQAIERAIVLEPLRAPSVAAEADRSLARHLKGDLDNIILCAMEKEPDRRYASVECLAEDLQRFLDHRPIRAGPDSTRYRVRKFIRRNRVSVALGAMVALAIAAGAIVERRQSTIAQQRSEDVRKLATSIVFDVDDAVRPLPGSTRARQLIARTGIDYLNNLSRSSAGDWDLKRELASAWTRIGILKGGLNSSNLGDASAALASFGNASRLLDDVQQHDRSDAKAALERITLLYETSNVQWTLGRYNEAAASAEAGLRIAETHEAVNGKNREFLQSAGLLHLALARIRQQLGDIAAAESEVAAGGRVLRRLAEVSPDDRQTHFDLSALDVCVGNVKAVQGRTQEALANYRAAVAELEMLCRRYPADTLARRKLIFAYGWVGDTLGNPMFQNTGDSQGAFQAYGQMADQAKLLYEADSVDARAAGDYGSALLKLGLATPLENPRRKQTLATSRALLERAAAVNPQNRTIANNLTRAESELGHYEAAIEEAEKTLRSAPEDWSALRVMEFAIRPLAEDQARKGQRQEALATLDHSLQWVAKADSAVSQTSRNVPSIAIAWQTAGAVYAILAKGETGPLAAADRVTAREWYGRAVDQWRRIEHDTAFLPAFAADMRADEQTLLPGGLDARKSDRR